MNMRKRGNHQKQTSLAQLPLAQTYLLLLAPPTHIYRKSWLAGDNTAGFPKRAEPATTAAVAPKPSFALVSQ